MSYVYHFFSQLVCSDKIQTQSTHGRWLIRLLNPARWVIQVAWKERLVIFQVSYWLCLGQGQGHSSLWVFTLNFYCRLKLTLVWAFDFLSLSFSPGSKSSQPLVLFLWWFLEISVSPVLVSTCSLRRAWSWPLPNFLLGYLPFHIDLFKITNLGPLSCYTLCSCSLKGSYFWFKKFFLLHIYSSFSLWVLGYMDAGLSVMFKHDFLTCVFLVLCSKSLSF